MNHVHFKFISKFSKNYTSILPPCGIFVSHHPFLAHCWSKFQNVWDIYNMDLVIEILSSRYCVDQYDRSQGAMALLSLGFFSHIIWLKLNFSQPLKFQPKSFATFSQIMATCSFNSMNNSDPHNEFLIIHHPSIIFIICLCFESWTLVLNT